MDSKTGVIKECWCGSGNFVKFSEHYVKCSYCGTLISNERMANDFYDVSDDDQSFYGKQYWFQHQNIDYGFEDIIKRFRTDLSERSLFWLDKIMSYRLPPVKTIELGCGPGSLVFLMQTVGYQASGTELSKFITDTVSLTFNVPMMVGKIEDLALESHGYDMVIIMDVLEHFTDPLGSLKQISKILADDGILVIQTPNYRGRSFSELESQEDKFLLQLKEKEHLYLFSENGLAQILQKVGLSHIQMEDAFFPYDMFVFASKKPLKKLDTLCIEEFLSSSPERRLIQGMMDLFHKWQVALKNAEARGSQIEMLTQWLRESEDDRANRLKAINSLEMLLKESEADRAERLKVINSLEVLLKESEDDRANRLKAINSLEILLKESEADREARLRRIQFLEQKLEKMNQKQSFFKEIISKIFK